MSKDQSSPEFINLIEYDANYLHNEQTALVLKLRVREGNYTKGIYLIPARKLREFYDNLVADLDRSSRAE